METLDDKQNIIESVVKGFESCTTPKDDFKHRDHLTVAVWYLRSSTPEEALRKMRVGLNRFLDHHGVGRQKYREDLTVAWMNLVREVMSKLDSDLSLVKVVNVVHERLGGRRLVLKNGKLIEE